MVYRISGSLSDDIVTVRFCQRGESAAAYARARQSAVDGDAVCHLPAWDGVAMVFPCDPDLPQLGAMTDIRRRPTAQTGECNEPDAGAAAWHVLSYLPGRRCALRYDWAGDAHAYVGKLGQGAERNHQRLTTLWNMPRRSFAMPEPLSVDSSLDVRWERLVPGERIEDALANADRKRVLSMVSKAAVALHTTTVLGLPHRGADRVLERLEQKVIPRIEASVPELSQRAHALVLKLREGLMRFPPRRLHTIHGDLHTANLLIQKDRAVFIDLDEIALGDSAYDLALLGSRFILAAWIAATSLDDIAPIVASLPQLYEESGGQPVPEAVFAWYMAALLVGRQIKTSIRHLAPDWPAICERLLTLAERTLERGRFDGAVE